MNSSAAMSGVEVVAADEREHFATGEPLDGLAEVGLHRLLELVADVVDRVDLAGVVRDFSAWVSTSCISVTSTFP
jgi:hypothetical protein